jgi:hypothetical protein
MPVDLISKDEKLVFKFEDAEIYYRRVPPIDRDRVIAKHTNRGTTNWTAVGLELCKTYVSGWKNFRMSGQEVEYDPKWFDYFPDDVLLDLYRAFGVSNVDGLIFMEKKEKNS